jgi:MATE family multidrug resistance protein
VTLAREVRKLAVPAIGTSLLQTAVFLVDRAMLGRHGSTDLAAMHIAGNVEWSIFSIMSAFTVGTLARVGMATGSGDRDGARDATIVSLAAAVVSGTILVLALTPLLSLLPRAFPAASAAAIEGARGYLSATLLASPAMLVGVTATAALQGTGDTRTPFLIAVAVNVVHVATNRVLILGAFGIPDLGARGAGISTALTFVLESSALLVALRRPSSGACLTPLRWPTEARREIRDVGRIAWPAVAERSALHAGFLLYTAIIGLLGDAAMAANQGLISVESVCFLSADGFGVAAAAIVAKKVGEGEPDQARRAAGVATRSAVALLAVLAATIVVFRAPLVRAFEADPSVAALAIGVVPVLAIAQPFMATGIVLSQAVRGAGATRVALGVSFVGSLLVRVGTCYALAIRWGMGLTGVWIGSTLDWLARSLLLGIFVSVWGDRMLRGAVDSFVAERRVRRSGRAHRA